MTGFAYHEGRLHAEAVPLDTVAAQVGTPCYVYSQDAMQAAFDRFAGALESATRRKPLVCFAVKANGNLSVLRALAARGAGADVVSGGELRRALAAGISPHRIVFSGVGKTRDELAYALESGIHQINVESQPELELLGELTNEMGVRAPVGIRVNPDVDASTHHKIATGRAGDKFGIDAPDVGEVLETARRFSRLDVVALAVHIGSHIYDLSAFERAFNRLTAMYGELRAEGWPLRRLDMGGGLGIAYDDATPPPDPEAYAEVVARSVGTLDAELAFEPGRFLVANAGVLVTRVTYVKPGRARPFVVVDAGMNDLIRPALYDAHHAITPVAEPHGHAGLSPVDVVGPVCETADTFATARSLPPIAQDDLLAIRSAGAYGAVMASMYNARLPAPEVMVHGNRWAVVQRPPDHDAVMAMQPVADWLT
ncbi:diaminopimelate decarboxylase, partial [Limimonas halophila]